MMNENRKLPDGVVLSKEDIFCPVGRWSFRRGDLVWSRTGGWQKYYEVKSEDCRFKTAEDAIKRWESSAH